MDSAVYECKYDDRATWLALRKNHIGGSDAGSVVGLNPYKSAYALWCEKTGKIPEFEGNLTTEVGAYLEEFVAKLFAKETGKKVRRKNAMLVNPVYPFAEANVDRVVVGENAILECKTTNSVPNMRKINGGEYPEQWYCQMTHYLAVTGCERAYLAVLINGREFKTFTLERNQDEIDALMRAEKDFWDHVESNTPPLVDGSDSTADAIETLYAEENGEYCDLFGMNAYLTERDAIVAKIADLTAQKTEIENKVKERMGEFAYGSTDDYKVTWKSQTRTTFDHKALAADFPGTDFSKYVKTSTTRVFKITKNKESK